MSHYHEQFLKQNPLAVLGVLRDLHKAAIPLRLSWNGGQLISKLLAITPDKLVLDFGSQAEDNIATAHYHYRRNSGCESRVYC